MHLRSILCDNQSINQSIRRTTNLLMMMMILMSICTIPDTMFGWAWYILPTPTVAKVQISRVVFCPCVRPSVCHKPALYQKAKHTITQIRPYDSLWTLIFRRQKSRWKPNWVTPVGRTKYKWGKLKLAIFDQYLAYISKTVQDKDVDTTER